VNKGTPNIPDYVPLPDINWVDTLYSIMQATPSNRVVIINPEYRIMTLSPETEGPFNSDDAVFSHLVPKALMFE
jgi:hypothetical protein